MLTTTQTEQGSNEKKEREEIESSEKDSYLSKMMRSPLAGGPSGKKSQTGSKCDQIAKQRIQGSGKRTMSQGCIPGYREDLQDETK